MPPKKNDMVAYFSGLLLKLFGWKKSGVFPEGEKFVVLAAPHTSLWDFVWGRLYYANIHKSVKFMIKEKYFFFPLGILLRYLGAIPVIMNKKTGMVNQMIDKFNTEDEFYLTITPEATRKSVRRWKKGFYHIALEAKVPVAMGFLDFKKRELGFLGTYHLTGDYKKDMAYFHSKYANIIAKHPEKYNPEAILN